MVESAIVIPLMVFMIVGVIQLAMIQHAKIMTEYAAFNAARAGIVWNADRFIMENAAMISLMPTSDSLVEEGDYANPARLLRRILQRALVHQITSKVPAAVEYGLGRLRGAISIPAAATSADNFWTRAGTGLQRSGGKMVNNMLNKGVDIVKSTAMSAAETASSSALGKALGDGDDRMVRVDIYSPHLGIASLGAEGVASGALLDMDTAIDGTFDTIKKITDFSQGATPLNVLGIAGFLSTGMAGSFGMNPEVDFDSMSNRAGTRLVIRVRYLYLLRVPFANWIIHGAYLAGQAGIKLYGAIWNPKVQKGATGFGKGGDYVRPRSFGKNALSSTQERDLKVVAKMADHGAYALPLYASHAMRMQSNPYRKSLLLR